MKRREDECFYDYQARRLLDQYRIAILALGQPHWISCVMAKKGRSLVKVEVQGTFVRPDKFRKLLTKANKKAYRKAQRKYKLAMQKMAPKRMRMASGSNVNALMVSP